MAHATSNGDKYVLAYRVKGTTEIQTYDLYYSDKAPWVYSYISHGGFPCPSEKYKRKAWIANGYNRAYCPPVTVTVAEKGNPTVQVTDPLVLRIEQLAWQNAIEYKDKVNPSQAYLFDPQKEYVFTIKDSNNDVQVFEMGKMNPSFSKSVNYKVDYCIGEKTTHIGFVYKVPMVRLKILVRIKISILSFLLGNISSRLRIGVAVTMKK